MTSFLPCVTNGIEINSPPRLEGPTGFNFSRAHLKDWVALLMRQKTRTGVLCIAKELKKFWVAVKRVARAVAF